MSGDRAIAFVHGIGGPCGLDAWLAPLDASLAGLRMPGIGPCDCIEIDYLSALQQGRVSDDPGHAWRRESPREQAQAWQDYLIRREAFAALIEGPRKRETAFRLGQVHPAVSDSVPSLLPIVNRYLTHAASRHAVWKAVLAQLPRSGRIVIVAHSLGSIVMLDLLTRLPEGLQVDLLLTIGSPIGIGVFRRHLAQLARPGDFPAERVGVWVNAYDPDDIVTAGRGAAQHFPAALDAPITTGLSHEISAYMAQPVVAAAVATAIFGPPSAPAERTPAPRLHASWSHVLLRFAYLHDLWRTWPTDKWSERGRMDTARRVLAERVMTEARQQRARFAEQVQALPPQLRSHPLADADARWFAPGRMPSAEALVRDAASLCAGEFTDDDLVLAGVDLLLSAPFAPFGIEIDQDRGVTALVALLESVRPGAAPGSSEQIAAAIGASVDDARKALGGRGIPWAPLLIGAGVLVLAGTGIGLAAAIPAGMAGAAAVTATLAAFGPGGMAGGVATLAVLTGTSTALASAGLARSGDQQEDVDRLQGDMATEIARMPVADFRTAIAGVLAVHDARRRLGQGADAAAVERTLLGMETTVLAEASLHEAIAPKSDAARQWRARARIIERALAWSARAMPEETTDARAEVSRAIELGESSRALPRSG